MALSKRVSSYLKSLSFDEYGIPVQLGNAVNYCLDSYFSRIDQLNNSSSNPPGDLVVHVKELWIDCEIHKSVSLNRSYPLFAKAKIAWAFDKMLNDGVYESIPFLDSYIWKNLVKDSYEFRVQQELLQIGPDSSLNLTVHGTFFIKNSTGSKFVVSIDFGYDNLGCSVSVISSPSKKNEAEKFLIDLDRSISENDIYFGKCLSFLRGSICFNSIRETGWNDIILKDDIIQEIRDNSIGVINNMDKLSSIGMIPNRNVILISPPGMAKTTVFRAVSHEVQDVTRIWCTGKSIEDASDVTLLFEAARSLAPCIIFIEDMDLFGRDRGSLSGHESHVLNEFLTCLDGMHQNSGVIIMASTNDIASMDEALVDRPGRFDVKIEIPYPDDMDRKQMLILFLKKFNAHPDKSVTVDTIKTVVDLTDGLTGAYIKELVKATVIKAVSNGNTTSKGVVFSADDLNSAAEQVVRNYRIGKAARKKFQAEVTVA